MSKFWKPSHVTDRDAQPLLTAAKIHKNATSRLPIAKHRLELLYALEHHQVVVLVGETGSGKTTQVLQYLHHAGWTDNNKTVVCTQPRTLAAKSVATRVADEMNEKLGGLVGFAVRFDNRTSTNTAIKFCTDGLLLRETMYDGLLSKYSVIMVDEAHERSLNSDILLGLLKKIMSMSTVVVTGLMVAGILPAIGKGPKMLQMMM